jgi:hypothetical protein
MEAGGLVPKNLIQPTISLEMSVPSKGHCGFQLTDCVRLLTYEFFLPLWKIARWFCYYLIYKRTIENY